MLTFDERARSRISYAGAPKQARSDLHYDRSVNLVSFRLATSIDSRAAEPHAVRQPRLSYFEASKQDPADRVRTTLQQSGEPLDPSTRALMERRFDVDLGHIRVHADTRAAEVARDLDADAYSVGRHIGFAEGTFAPRTATGRLLLAHELAHAAHNHGDLGPGRLVIGDPGGPAERAADRVTTAASTGLRGPSKHELSRAAGSHLTVQLRPSAKEPGKELWKERADPDEEQQRIEAFNILRENRALIRNQAATFNVDPVAVAGAILWEAIENPYHLSFVRLGPGKVHPIETVGKSEAEKVEDEGRVSAAKDWGERLERLRQADWAIRYIAAIMRRHADNYLKIAGVDISRNVGVLCTLYQGGNSEDRAHRLAEKRKTEPTAQPQPGDKMWPWVELHKETIKGWIDPPPRPH